MLILLNKPFGVLCQFSDPDGRPTLKDYVDVPHVYAAGRLDFDSEGLLVLTNDGPLQARISQPTARTQKRYWAQVEGRASLQQLEALLEGVEIKDGAAKASAARCIDAPAALWDRNPPIRYRANIPTSWIDIALTEGRNRQVRRMTAAVGLPTLRLVRYSIGPWALDGLAPGESRAMPAKEAWKTIQGR